MPGGGLRRSKELPLSLAAEDPTGNMIPVSLELVSDTVEKHFILSLLFIYFTRCSGYGDDHGNASAIMQTIWMFGFIPIVWAELRSSWVIRGNHQHYNQPYGNNYQKMGVVRLLKIDHSVHHFRQNLALKLSSDSEHTSNSFR